MEAAIIAINKGINQLGSQVSNFSISTTSVVCFSKRYFKRISASRKHIPLRLLFRNPETFISIASRNGKPWFKVQLRKLYTY